MKIALGAPISHPESLLEWARRADAGPFSAIGALDRIVYDNPEAMVMLAAVAGATRRIRVQTQVLLSPLRNAAMLAKQAATIDRLSQGRFTLGLGIGGREDDFRAVGADPRGRGRHFEEQLGQMRAIWSGSYREEEGGSIGPLPLDPRGPELLIGALHPTAVERAARWADGIMSVIPLPYTSNAFRDAERMWSEAGRDTSPRLVAQINVVLGSDDAVERARERLRDYYLFLGDDPAFGTDQMLARMLTTPEELRESISQYRDIGTDELMLYCWDSDVAQLDRLSEVV